MKIMKYLAVAFLALTPMASYAEDAPKPKVVNVSKTDFVVPVQKIEGAENPVDLGEVIFLNVSKLDKVPENFVSSTVEWKVFDKGVEKKFFKTTDGTGIFFGSGVVKRKITVFASVSYLYVVKDGDKFVEAAVKSVFLTATVEIGGKEPDPVDPVDPDPTFPDGTYKLASKAYKLGEKVAKEHRKGGEYLGKSFTGQASKIASGQELVTAADIKKVLEETTAANRKALTDNSVSVAAWDAYFVALQDEIYELYSSGKLKSKNDFATAWREIGEGLSKVK